MYAIQTRLIRACYARHDRDIRECPTLAMYSWYIRQMFAVHSRACTRCIYSHVLRCIFACTRCVTNMYAVHTRMYPVLSRGTYAHVRSVYTRIVRDAYALSTRCVRGKYAHVRGMYAVHTRIYAVIFTRMYPIYMRMYCGVYEHVRGTYALCYAASKCFIRACTRYIR